MKNSWPAFSALAATLLVGCGDPSAARPDAGREGQRGPASAHAVSSLAPVAPAVRVAEPALASERGAATYYADTFEGQETASGRTFRQGELVAAHRRYPFGTLLRVTNLDNQRSVQVRVADRGPFGAPWKSQRRIIDLSKRAARELAFLDQGFARVHVEVIRYGSGLGAG